MSITTEEVIDLQTNYVCARCYHPVIAVPDGEGGLVAKCSNPNCDGEGFVKRAYAEKRKAESWSELVEARENMKAFIPVASDNKSCDEILTLLGF